MKPSVSFWVGTHSRQVYMTVLANVIQPLDYSKLKSVELVLLLIQASPELVRDIIHNPQNHYHRLRVKRRRGSNIRRVVYRTSLDARRLHRTIALSLEPFIQDLSPHVQGFRKGYSVVSNAQLHCDKPVVVVADIKDFFGSITTRCVQDLFQHLGAEYQPALMLARLCTLNEALPQGGRASPAIANLVADSLDKLILNRYPSLSYSRYADNIILSGNGCPAYAELDLIFAQCGFTLKPSSYRCIRSGDGQYVTGLNVDSDRPKAPRRARRDIERALHVSTRYSIEEYMLSAYKTSPSIGRVNGFKRSLLGMISSYGAVDEAQRQEWLAKFRSIQSKPSLQAKPAGQNIHESPI
jgi:hypothetical protein